MLAIGVLLAASRASFAWTPVNDAVHCKIRKLDRPTDLSGIGTGTSVGIAKAGAIALAMVLSGFKWRICSIFSAGASALAFVGNWVALRQVEKSPEEASHHGWRDRMHPAAVPLCAIPLIAAAFVQAGL